MRREKQKEKPFALARLAEEALKEAVYETIKDHEKTGDPVVIWRNGKVVHVDPRKLKIAEPSAQYKVKKKKRNHNPKKRT